MTNIKPATNVIVLMVLIILLNESQCCAIGLDEMGNDNVNIKGKHLVNLASSRQFI
jgi:hypothetical protein